MRPTGVEPVAYRLGICRSIHPELRAQFLITIDYQLPPPPPPLPPPDDPRPPDPDDDPGIIPDEGMLALIEELNELPSVEAKLSDRKTVP